MRLFQKIKWAHPKKWLQHLIKLETCPTALPHIKALLREKKIPYRVLPHPDAFSASALAESLHVTGKEVAKVVIIRSNRGYVMAVLPSHLQVNLRRMARLLKTDHVSIATREELIRLFPDCEVGAMPPFGDFYGLPVYVDVSLTQAPVLFFPAGTHCDVIEMRYRDFEHLVQPEIGAFAAVPITRYAV